MAGGNTTQLLIFSKDKKASNICKIPCFYKYSYESINGVHLPSHDICKSVIGIFSN